MSDRPLDSQALESLEFEKGMERLGKIIELFDMGGLTLDQMEQYFCEGMQLIEANSKKLDRVEIRVKQLIQAQQDAWSEEPFESGGEDAASPHKA